MMQSRNYQILTMIAAVLGAAFFVVVDTPFVANVAFTILAIAWAGWIFYSIYRGGDEVMVASVRYAFALASGVGVPISIAFVLLMIARSDIQSVITHISSLSRSDLPPAVAGFGFGVTFTLIVLSAVFAIGHSCWWASKR